MAFDKIKIKIDVPGMAGIIVGALGTGYVLSYSTTWGIVLLVVFAGVLAYRIFRNSR